MMYAVDDEGRIRLYSHHKEGVPQGSGSLVFVGEEFPRHDAGVIAQALNRAVLVGKGEAQSEMRRALGIVGGILG